jgi:hypothetical protein
MELDQELVDVIEIRIDLLLGNSNLLTRFLHLLQMSFRMLHILLHSMHYLHNLRP